MQSTLLRIVIQNILTEDIDPGSDYGPSLEDVFLTPFRDAGNVIKGELKKISANAQGAIAKTVNGTLSLASGGFFKENLKEIDHYVQHQLEAVERDPEYQKAWAAVKPHAKTAIEKMMFMTDPIRFLTSKIASTSATEALKVSSSFLTIASREALIALGKKLDVRRGYSNQEYERFLLNLIHDKQSSSKKHHEHSSIRGRILLEQKEDEAVAQFLLAEPEFMSILRSSHFVKGMEGVLTQLGNEVAKRFTTIANKIKSAPNLSVLNHQLGITSSNDLKKLGNESQEAEKIAYEEVKTGALRRLATSLATHIKRLELTDVENNAYIRPLKVALKDIASTEKKQL